MTRTEAPTTAQLDAIQLDAMQLDAMLTAQLAVAWAGEGGDEPRLGWWRTDLVSEYGGEDLFRRLLPDTWRWATLQAVREAARRTDAARRGKAHDPDGLVTLYRHGFALDERLDERFQHLKRAGKAPKDALPGLAKVIAENWASDAFAAWVGTHDGGDAKSTPAGPLLRGAPPVDLTRRAAELVASLAPLGPSYPMPHYRTGA